MMDPRVAPVKEEPAKFVKFTKMFLRNMEGSIAKDYYEWAYIRMSVAGSYTPVWMKKGEVIHTEEDWAPSKNNEQAFDLLHLFDLLGTNKEIFTRVLNANQDDLNIVSKENPDDPHAASRIGILMACIQVLLRNRVEKKIGMVHSAHTIH